MRGDFAAAVAAAAAPAVRAPASPVPAAGGDLNILKLPARSKGLGQPVVGDGYGKPSKFEANVQRRPSPGLTQTTQGSVPFAPLRAKLNQRTRLVPAVRWVDADTVLEVDDERLQIRHVGPAHTPAEMMERARLTRRRWLSLALTSEAGWLALPAQGAEPAGVIDWPPLVDIEGRAIAVESWRGIPAVIVFWTTSCAFCKRHNAHIDRLFRSADGSGLHVMGVVLDSDAAAARQYMKVQGYRFPVVVDDGRLRARFTERRVIPMTCTVAGDGRLLQCIPGEMAQDDVLGLARLARA